MKRAAVVPHHGVAVAPVVAVDELRLRDERGQLVEQHGAFRRRHADDLLRVRADVERAAAVDGIGADHRVRDDMALFVFLVVAFVVVYVAIRHAV